MKTFLPIGSIAAVLFLMSSCATSPDRHFADLAALPAQSAFPDPLVMLDGRRVTTSN